MLGDEFCDVLETFAEVLVDVERLAEGQGLREEFEEGFVNVLQVQFYGLEVAFEQLFVDGGGFGLGVRKEVGGDGVGDEFAVV